MTTQKVLTLFLASPGDVNPERTIVREIVDELNNSTGKIAHIRVEVVGWDTDARPSWGADAQKILNGQIGDMSKHALFVGIFWNRLGTPTPRAQSGTLEEFQRAAQQSKNKRPEIMLYFNQAPFNLNSKGMLDQKQNLLEFKDSIRNKGVYWDYKGKAGFEKAFRKHYGDWLRDKVQEFMPKADPGLTLPVFNISDGAAIQRHFEQAKSKPKETSPTKKLVRKTNHSSLIPILLDEHLFYAEKVSEVGSLWKLTIRPQHNSDDQKIRSLLTSNRRHSSFPLAFQLQGGQAEIIKDGERSSDEKGDLWMLELRFTSRSQGSWNTISFAGPSPNEIAHKKAEWLLLAKRPELPAAGNLPVHQISWQERQIIGHGVEGQPIFPRLWKQVQSDTTKFAATAHLIAVSRLLNAGVCDHIEELQISAIRSGKVNIKFRGSHPSVMDQKPENIVVQGTCPLEIEL